MRFSYLNPSLALIALTTIAGPAHADPLAFSGAAFGITAEAQRGLYNAQVQTFKAAMGFEAGAALLTFGYEVRRTDLPDYLVFETSGTFLRADWQFGAASLGTFYRHDTIAGISFDGAGLLAGYESGPWTLGLQASRHVGSNGTGIRANMLVIDLGYALDDGLTLTAGYEVSDLGASNLTREERKSLGIAWDAAPGTELSLQATEIGGYDAGLRSVTFGVSRALGNGAKPAPRVRLDRIYFLKS